MKNVNLKREIAEKLEEVLQLMKGLEEDERNERVSIDMKELAHDMNLEANIEDHLETKGNTFVVAGDVFLILRKGESINLTNIGEIVATKKPEIVKLNAINKYTALAGVYEIFSAYYNQKVEEVEVIEEKEEVVVKKVTVNTPAEEPEVVEEVEEVEVVQAPEIPEVVNEDVVNNVSDIDHGEDNVFFSITPSSSGDNSVKEESTENKASGKSPFGKKLNFAPKKIKFHGTQSDGTVDGRPALFANNNIAKADVEAPAGRISLDDALAGNLKGKETPKPTSEYIFGANRELGYNPHYGKCFEVYQGSLHLVPKNEIPNVNEEIAEEYIWIESDGSLRIGNTITDEDALEAISESLNNDTFRNSVSNVVLEVLEEYATSM